MCSTMPNQPFSPGSRLCVWVRGAPCHRRLAHSGAQCPCQSRQHVLPLLAPALAGKHNISQLATMACLPAPTIWLLRATILTHITNYSRSRDGERLCWLVLLLEGNQTSSWSHTFPVRQRTQHDGLRRWSWSSDLNVAAHPRVRSRNNPGVQLSGRCERLLLQPLLH